MKGLGLIDKMIFFVNSIFALLLLLSLIVPYIPPQQFPSLSVLSLVVAPLLLANVLFLLYWILRVKKQMLLSLIVLLVCFVQFNSFYRVDFSRTPEIKSNELRIMSYNVRIFNVYGWIDDDEIPQKMEKLIAEDNPDVISIQEFHTQKEVSFANYPYRYIKLQSTVFGQAIYSKYPIVNEGSLDFENSGNNAIFVDVVKGKDTIRVYNLHLESLQIHPEDLDFRQEAAQSLIKRISRSFEAQQGQIEKVLAHEKESPYRSIITADLNNTAFSYVYRKLKTNKNDAFAEAGKGLGKTFEFKNIPLRIDFILTDKYFTITDFKTFTEEYSDHYPISASITWD